jgi:hypothetical protein
VLFVSPAEEGGRADDDVVGWDMSSIALLRKGTGEGSVHREVSTEVLPVTEGIEVTVGVCSIVCDLEIWLYAEGFGRVGTWNGVATMPGP